MSPSVSRYALRCLVGVEVPGTNSEDAMVRLDGAFQILYDEGKLGDPVPEKRKRRIHTRLS